MLGCIEEVAPARKPSNPQFMDLEGRKYGHLVVSTFAGSDGKHSWWWCRCECGATTKTTANKLRQGHTTSCGCWKKRSTARRMRTHGLRTHSLYNTWAKMRRRCLASKDAAYRDYGGRGIRVCDRWLTGDGEHTGFECFLHDMGSKPTPEHSLDRRDGGRDYEPGNCRWATKSEQARNRRNNRYVMVDDQRMSVAEACGHLGLRYEVVNGRLQKGWSFERAISQPVRRSSR